MVGNFWLDLNKAKRSSKDQLGVSVIFVLVFFLALNYYFFELIRKFFILVLVFEGDTSWVTTHAVNVAPNHHSK